MIDSLDIELLEEVLGLQDLQQHAHEATVSGRKGSRQKDGPSRMRIGLFASIAADQNASVDAAYFDTRIAVQVSQPAVPDRGALTVSRQSKWADPLERGWQQRRF